MRHRRPSSEEDLLPLLDTLSNGVGAAVLLFLIFTVAGAAVAPGRSGLQDQLIVQLRTQNTDDRLVAWFSLDGNQQGPFELIPVGGAADHDKPSKLLRTVLGTEWSLVSRLERGERVISLEATADITECWSVWLAFTRRLSRSGKVASADRSEVSAYQSGVQDPIVLQLEAAARSDEPITAQLDGNGRTVACKSQTAE